MLIAQSIIVFEKQTSRLKHCVRGKRKRYYLHIFRSVENKG